MVKIYEESDPGKKEFGENHFGALIPEGLYISVYRPRPVIRSSSELVYHNVVATEKSVDDLVLFRDRINHVINEFLKRDEDLQDLADIAKNETARGLVFSKGY